MAKYCTNCGKTMDSDATFCIECGTHNSGEYKGGSSFSERVKIDKGMILPAVGVALACTAPLAGLIVSIVALIVSSKNEGKGKKAAISGICIASFRIFIVLTLFVISFIKTIKR